VLVVGWGGGVGGPPKFLKKTRGGGG